jgi:hypothetical protein
VKYADDLVLLTKEETVLQGMIDQLKFEDAVEGKCGKKLRERESERYQAQYRLR